MRECWCPQYFNRLFSYRELIAMLALREIKVKYKSAVLGWLWSILHPLLLMVIFSFIFTYVFKINIEKPHIYLLAGLLPWFFMSFAVSSAVTAVVDNSQMIKAVYFPQEIIPLAVTLGNLYNFLLSLGLFIIFLTIFGETSAGMVIVLSFVILLQFFFVFGIAMLVSALHTMFRDVKYLVEVLMMTWFYATPIFYPADLVPTRFAWLLYVNPMSIFVMMYREIFMYKRIPNSALWFGGVAAGLLWLLVGGLIFRGLKKYFADVT